MAGSRCYSRKRVCAYFRVESAAASAQCSHCFNFKRGNHISILTTAFTIQHLDMQNFWKFWIVRKDAVSFSVFFSGKSGNIKKKEHYYYWTRSFCSQSYQMLQHSNAPNYIHAIFNGLYRLLDAVSRGCVIVTASLLSSVHEAETLQRGAILI